MARGQRKTCRCDIHRGVTDLVREGTDGVREEVVTYTTINDFFALVKISDGMNYFFPFNLI